MSRFLVPQWVIDSVLSKSLPPEKTGVAFAARLASWRRIITTAREAVVDAQFDSLPNDLRLGQSDERRVDLEVLTAFDSGLGCEVGHPCERFYELRTAVGISAVIEGVHPYENVAASENFGPSQSERQEDRVANRDGG